MKRVEQKRGTDCGVACVAMIAGITYETAEEAMGLAVHSRTEVRDLRKALEKFGYNLGYRSIPATSEKLRCLHFDCILKTKPGPKSRNWHWMVWDSRTQSILDPLPEGKAYKRPESRVYAYIQVMRMPSHEL